MAYWLVLGSGGPVMNKTDMFFDFRVLRILLVAEIIIKEANIMQYDNFRMGKKKNAVHF